MMKNTDKSISILGCGWLGFPLAKRLIENRYQVKGSTTSTDKLASLSEAGIKPFHISLSPHINSDYQTEFFDSHVLVLNIPPSRRQADIEQIYPLQVSEVLKMAGETSLKKILFISSSSVYPNLNKEVKEEDAGGEISNSGNALLKAEQILLNQNRFQVNIIRFCGLFDLDRNPGRFLAGKTLSSSGHDHINLIHLEDCINIIKKMIEKDAWGETFNACADQHPEKESFYQLAAKKMGLEPPVFKNDAQSNFKIVNSDKLKWKLDYKFEFPDPAKVIKES